MSWLGGRESQGRLWRSKPILACFLQLAEPLRLARPARLPDTFARLPAVAACASTMTPKMTLGTSVSGYDRDAGWINEMAWEFLEQHKLE